MLTLFLVPPAGHAPRLHDVRNADAFAADPAAAGWQHGPVPRLQLQSLPSCAFQPSADGKAQTDAAAAQWLHSATGLAVPAASDWLPEVTHLETMIAIVDTALCHVSSRAWHSYCFCELAYLYVI